MNGWSRFYDAAGDDPRQTLLDALDGFDGEGERPRFAVDLGCGTGRDTIELLRRGWRVLAIDGEPEAIARLRVRTGDDARLETQVATFEDAEWPETQLVNASFALPFCPPGSFPRLWSRIASSLPPAGRFCGQLFGDRDGWSGEPDLTFLTRDEAEALFGSFDLERFDEVEQDGRTALGAPKHWHVFHVVARKR